MDVPRPDGIADKLGLIVLDEPCAKQSDPTVLDLQLRAISKETTFKSVTVKTLENADKRPKEIDAWINSISNLHRSKPPPTVHYSRFVL
ncbi:intraflagellar transport protein 46 homolog [Stegodyphus dumicola]|uniref:intraflagellar transport protein 46 homolog n=1 Tax=Stegodyphus dumicola TaxID=202533 RepID=UPI0015AB0FAA|nr:intraflagellar transport protein 46 homolog [Stegodyphus dumicola]